VSLIVKVETMPKSTPARNLRNNVRGVLSGEFDGKDPSLFEPTKVSG
jgi:hypothetical protein